MSDEKESLEAIIARQQADIRRDIRMRRLLEEIRSTVRLRPIKLDSACDDCYVELTDETARVLAPFMEAADIVRAIIYASDQCVGHRFCGHSMEPWKRARALVLAMDNSAQQEKDRLQRARIGDSEIIGRWQCQAEKAEQEIARLREALTTYGVHKWSCASRPRVTAGFQLVETPDGIETKDATERTPAGPCDCGLEAALREEKR